MVNDLHVANMPRSENLTEIIKLLDLKHPDMGLLVNSTFPLILILSFFAFVYLGLYRHAVAQFREASISTTMHYLESNSRQHQFPSGKLESRESLQIERIRPLRDKRFPCDDHTPSTYFGRRGNNWVLYNYFKATRTFLCDVSITYTTHADWTFLDNLLPLLERWQGPISLTLYGPGTDFNESLRRIQYLRECFGLSLIKEFVTFHIFFDEGQRPPNTIPLDPESLPINCSEISGIMPLSRGHATFKELMNLTYPVNVARNIAKEMATTHYVFPSDIELYPSPNLIPKFLTMIYLNNYTFQKHIKKVFVLPVFELEANVTVLPRDKLELIQLIRKKSAVIFHKYVCLNCHQIPNMTGWLNSTLTKELNVFHVAKRHKPYHHWEPFYIGTKEEPMFDERLSWDGMKDKRVQCYLLCLLDYEFHILDNAFLVHRPGIKGKRKQLVDEEKRNRSRLAVYKQNRLIVQVIVPELKHVYGNRTECRV